MYQMYQMDTNAQIKLTKKRRLLVKQSSATFDEILRLPESGETSFCGERIHYDSCNVKDWEVYELENRKLL